MSATGQTPAALPDHPSTRQRPDHIAWAAYRALGVEPDLDAVGFLSRPVTYAELAHIRRVVRETVSPGPLRFASYIGPDGRWVHDDVDDESSEAVA